MIHLLIYRYYLFLRGKIGNQKMLLKSAFTIIVKITKSHLIVKIKVIKGKIKGIQITLYTLVYLVTIMER
jgi:hypothetical protein